MAAASISLTVRSVNDVVITATAQDFIVARMTAIQANQNLDTTPSVTEVGDASTQLSAWSISGTGDKLYWGLWVISGTNYAVALYRDSAHKVMLAYGERDAGGAAGTIYGTPKNESGIYFQVTYAYSADDVDAANTVQCTTFTSEKDLELPGTTQFMYDVGGTNFVKYTVDETTSSINAAIDGDSQWITASVTLTTAQITILNGTPVAVITAPGALYAIEVQGGFVNYNHATADITGNLTADLVTSTTETIIQNATNAFSGAADKITRFIPVAGVLDANEGISVMMHTGDPTMGTSTGTATVTVTYRITAI